MLHVVAADRLDTLAGALAGTLAPPLPDPMTPEWVVVVNGGTERWLRLALARRLGASEGRTDGVAANLDLLFPQRLLWRVLGDARDDEDPWDLERLPWAVLDVLARPDAASSLGPVAELPPGGTWWGRARRLADLLDRYQLHRPVMVRRWARGEDVDGVSDPLPAGAAWQPLLFRRVRDLLGVPSPAERLPDRIGALRAGHCPEQVPPRVSLFGLSTVPGGAPFLELLDALATQREVHLFVLRPSPGMAHRAAAAGPADPATFPRRPSTDGLVAHPLLASWARPSLDTELLLAGRTVEDAGGPAPGTATLLGRLQEGLRSGTPPSGDARPDPGDRSVTFHSCHGATRQVEVLRDQVLHLLAADPTLSEDDVVVMCPSLETFAPLVEATFGPPAPNGPALGRVPSPPVAGPPALAYRIVDRSLRDASPLFAALSTLVDLLGSRCTAPALLELLSLPPVRARFGLDDDAVGTVAAWVEEADVRWGLDGGHREAWGVPAAYTGGSWGAALDRLLLGVAVSDDDDLPLAAGGVLPLGVEGGDVALAGRLADVLARLRRLVDRTRSPLPAAAWAELLGDAADDLFSVGPRDRWQRNRLATVLGGLAGHSCVGGRPVDVGLTLADVRRWLAGALGGGGGRAEFFRGGVTVSSLTALRGIPARVVCLLGMDERCFGSPPGDGDDLTTAAPHLGDRDRRAEVRQALLESVLAAGDHLVVVRSGHSVVTNQPVPPAVPVAELWDAVAATVHPDVRAGVLERIATVHPRQAFDGRNFRAAGTDGSAGPWSFDPVARDAAVARSGGRVPARPLVSGPLDRPDPAVVDLADLRDVLVHPVRHFLRRGLGIVLPEAPDRDDFPLRGGSLADGVTPLSVGGPDIDLALDFLQRWKLRDRLLHHLLAGGDVDGFAERELARGCLPPGRLGRQVLDDAAAAMGPVVDAVDGLGVTWSRRRRVLADVQLPDGTRVVGSVLDRCGDRPGPVQAHAGATKPKRLIGPWLDAAALVATDPGRPWRSSLVTTAGGEVCVEHFEVGTADPQDARRAAVDALSAAVDCYRHALREPLLVLPELSRALHRGEPRPESIWTNSRPGGGEGEDRWVAFAFAGLGLDELLAQPARPGDPPGAAEGRAERFAHHLWGTIDRWVAAPDPSPSPVGSGTGAA